MRRVDIDRKLRPAGLTLLLDITPEADDAVPEGTQTLALIGPEGPAFWTRFSTSTEYLDGNPDPLDRWSRRMIDPIARSLGGTAIYPFGGPPWHPFVRWATRSARAWTSPVGLLVHDRHGLFVSFRAALALPMTFKDRAPQPERPCDTCPSQPCLTACPPRALGEDGYDLPACHAYLDTRDGNACMSGCLVRKACPIGADLRPQAQSAFHMSAFHRSD